MKPTRFLTVTFRRSDGVRVRPSQRVYGVWRGRLLTRPEDAEGVAFDVDAIVCAVRHVVSGTGLTAEFETLEA